MKIYTRGGDKGRTSLFTGERVDKAEARIEALGSLDELVAALGMARAVPGADEALEAPLERLQTDLYLAMADIAGEATGESHLPANGVAALEAQIDAMDADLPELRDFVIPGTSQPSAALHVARTVCRRAERRVIAVAREHDVPPAIIAYLNRMADLLFTMARWVDRADPQAQTTFKQRL